MASNRAAHGFRRHPGKTFGNGRQLRQPEIKNLRVTSARDKNVCWLDVTMDNALCMGRIQSFCDFDPQRQQSRAIEWAAAYAVPECAAFQILHRDKRGGILFAYV